MEIEVKGHSGCPIDIVRENNDLFIYKSSYDKCYLDRLSRQAKKQEEAFRQEYQHIRIPEIFNVTQDDDHVTIKMEYVYSRNFIEYFESAGFEQVDYFIKALVLFIEKELKASPLQLVQTSITLEKFEDVKIKIANNSLLSDDDEIKKLLIESEKRFLNFGKQRTIKIPLGICHGDLTFSNILFNGNNYYLIDFLDSFIESPLLDIVKIRQDSSFLWSQLMYVKQYDQLRLKIICNKIDQEIDSYFHKYEWYRDYYEIYQLMNLLRILQYAKEKNVVDYLKDGISNLLNKRTQTTCSPELRYVIQSFEPFSLIVPAAADNPLTPDILPYVFSLDENGIMLCLKAILGLNLDIFDNIYITILRKHAEKFDIDEMMRLQFNRLAMQNVHLVILDNPTSSQTETVYQTIKKTGLKGGFFIKDADGYFKGIVRKENGIAIYPLEKMTMVNPQNKSYVAVDDMNCITNVIEKRIINHYFNAGGSCFEDSNEFCELYERLSKIQSNVYVSHIIYCMLLSKKKFRPIETEDFIDWGNRSLYEYYSKSRK